MRLQGLKWWALALLLSVVTTVSYAQSARHLRISEIVLNNKSGIVDEFGERSAWIELYNPSAATINVGGLFLTDDLSQPQKFPIRTGHRSTIVPPYQSFVLFLDGNAAQGTKHSDMILDPAVENTLYLFDSDGRLLVDQVVVPPLGVDESYARTGENHDFAKTSPTPGELNEYSHGRENLKQFKVNDPSGLVMTLIAMSVVFLSLVILFFVFNAMGRYSTKRVKAKASQVTGKSIEEIESTVDLPAEVYAAIGMALYQFKTGVHDEENRIITINNPSRRYSPWNSKIHTLRQTPEVQRKR